MTIKRIARLYIACNAEESVMCRPGKGDESTLGCSLSCLDSQKTNSWILKHDGESLMLLKALCNSILLMV